MIPERNYFWGIQSGWLFYVLAAITLAIFAFGIRNHISIWAKGIRCQSIPLSGQWVLNVCLEGLFGRRIFKGDPSAGVMHLLILWGFLGLFLGTLLLAIDHYFFEFLKGPVYLGYSLCLDIAGLMLTIGLIWALMRRYVLRLARLERRIEDWAVVVWLIAVALSGFVVEGLRLAAQRPAWGNWSFAGYGISFLFPEVKNLASLYPFFWWGHSLLSLGFIAMIPYSKLLHVLTAPVSIYLKDQPLQAVSLETREDGESTFSYRELISFDACTRCGRCAEVCPSTGAGETFSPRDFIIKTRASLIRKHNLQGRLSWFNDEEEQKGFDARKLWHCTTCRACLEVCPVFVGTPDAIRQARCEVVEEGEDVPSLLFKTLEKLYKYNNPLGASKRNRAKWAEDFDVREFSENEKAEGLCYFVGCTTSFDTRAQEIARSFSRILKHAGSPFGILGKIEPCCGDIARRVGEDGLYEEHMEACLDLFDRYGIQQVVTSSPHCFHTFRNEYPAFQALKPSDERIHFDTFHYTQILEKLIVKGSIAFKKPMAVKVTYHDPCYLGRHNGIFDTPRKILTAIPGVELHEMRHHMENSLCCGGGGGRMWQDELDAETKMAEIRIREAGETGAEILLTACPLCLIMLEDACKTVGLDQSLRVMDLNELVTVALGLYRV